MGSISAVVVDGASQGNTARKAAGRGARWRGRQGANVD